MLVLSWVDLGAVLGRLRVVSKGCYLDVEVCRRSYGKYTFSYGFALIAAPSCPILGPSWDRFGLSWAALGVFESCVGRSWNLLGSILGLS